MRAVRRRRGLSQRGFAEVIGTPQAMIARYEAGQVQPSLERLTQMVGRAGFRLTVAVEEAQPHLAPRTHELHDRRSLAYHQMVADAARRDPEVLAAVRERVGQWLSGERDFAASPEYAQAWSDLLARPDLEVLGALVEDREWMRAMRQSSPFNGILGQAVWNQIVREIQPEHRAPSAKAPETTVGPAVSRRAD